MRHYSTEAKRFELTVTNVLAMYSFSSCMVSVFYKLVHRRTTQAFLAKSVRVESKSLGQR